MDSRLPEWAHIWHLQDHFPGFQNILLNSKHIISWSLSMELTFFFTPPAMKMVSHYYLVKLLLLLCGCTWHVVPKDWKISILFSAILTSNAEFGGCAYTSLCRQPSHHLFLDITAGKVSQRGQILPGASKCSSQLGNSEILLSFAVLMESQEIHWLKIAWETACWIFYVSQSTWRQTFHDLAHQKNPMWSRSIAY